MGIAIGAAALGLVVAPAPATAASEADLTGDWSISYSITCRASLDQEGANVSGFVYCAEAQAAVFNGTIDPQSGDFSLTGDISGLPVEVEGTLDTEGDSISGAWTFPPLFADATFTGFRDPPDVGDGIAGGWTIDVLSGHCDAAVDQSGASLSAAVACVGPGDAVLSGDLAGSFDEDTGAVDLSGSVVAETELTLSGTLAKDGDAIDGTWSLDPTGLAGNFDAVRQAAAATPSAEVTATAVPQLPATGDGPDRRGSAVVVSLAGAFALGGLVLVLISRRRWRT